MAFKVGPWTVNMPPNLSLLKGEEVLVLLLPSESFSADALV